MLQVDVRLTSMPYQVFRERFPIVFKQDDTTNESTPKATTTTIISGEDVKTHDVNNIDTNA